MSQFFRALLGQSAGGGGSLPVSSPLVWYKRGTGLYTDAGTTLASADGDRIAQWNDQSGNGYHATQTTSADRPEYRPLVTYLSQPALKFKFNDGAGTTHNYFLVIPDAVGAALNTAGAGEFFVTLKDTDANTGGLNTQRGSWKFGTSGAVALFLWEDGKIYEDWGTNTRHDAISPGQDLSDAFSVYNVWSASNDYAVNLDGVSLFTTATSTVSFPATGIHFGECSGFGLAAYVSEVVIFARKLTSGDRASMLTYLT